MLPFQVGLLLLLPASCGASMFWDEVKSLSQFQQDAAEAASNAARNLQFTINYSPGADPVFVCNEFEKASNGEYECDCSYAPDKSISMSCLSTASICNDESRTWCYRQNITFGMTTENVIKELETCTLYDEPDFSRFEGE